jgi:hypothetical protein
MEVVIESILLKFLGNVEKGSSRALVDTIMKTSIFVKAWATMIDFQLDEKELVDIASEDIF